MIDHYAGFDLGASTTKIAVIDKNKKITASAVMRSGLDFSETCNLCLEEALKKGNIEKEWIKKSTATGYGRSMVELADDTKTEISCHAKGCYNHFPKAITIVDIGAQDCKIIKLDDDGKRTEFKMNRKCAAGTGAFLEEISAKLDIPISEFDALAGKSTKTVELGAYCTVFTSTEILDKLRHGLKAEDVIKGVFRSCVKRILEMDILEGDIVLSGGVVHHNPLIATIFEEFLNKPVSKPPYPQLMGAFGAALYALEVSNH
jgi:predicted CoA-substrate-specific enzyme activase